MAVTHPFVSAVADGSDATLVRPSNWNADHTVADGSFVAAKLSAAAADVVFGRSSAGAGNGEEIAVTAAARSVLDDGTVAAMVDTLGGASSTGTGGLVRATSPTLVTPALGTPSSGTLTNCTGLPVAGGGTGSSTEQGARANLDTQFIILPASNSFSQNPGDGLTAFYGAWVGTTTTGFNNIYVLKACRIKAVRLAIAVAGTLGTTEQATASVRVNNTTDTTISAVVQYDAIGPTRFDNTAMDVALAAGAFFEFKVVWPTWVTNPTNVYHIFEAILE